MFGMILYADGEIFAAVSPSKRKLDTWAANCMPFQQTPANKVAWRARDKSGWYNSSDNAHELLVEFPANAQVIW